MPLRSVIANRPFSFKPMEGIMSRSAAYRQTANLFTQLTNRIVGQNAKLQMVRFVRPDLAGNGGQDITRITKRLMRGIPPHPPGAAELAIERLFDEASQAGSKIVVLGTV